MDENSEVKPVVRLRLFAQNSRVKDEMKNQGITMKQLVSLTGLSYMYLSTILNLHKIPSENCQIRIAIALKKPIDYLFPEILLNKVKSGAFDERVKDLNPGQVLALPSLRQEQLLPYFPIEDVENNMQQTQLHKSIDDVLDMLTPRERHVLKLRFGLEDGKSRTLEEVGQEFNVNRERIRQIEQKALRTLRHPRLSRKLKPFIDPDYIPPSQKRPKGSKAKKARVVVTVQIKTRPEPVYPTLKPVKTHGYSCPLCGYQFKHRNFETSHLLESHADLFILTERVIERKAAFYLGYNYSDTYKVITCKLCKNTASSGPSLALKHLRRVHLNVYKRLKTASKIKEKGGAK